MIVKNKFFYFGEIEEYNKGLVEPPEGWEQGYYYRFEIQPEDEAIILEDVFGRFIPIDWGSLWQLRGAIEKVNMELLKSVIGAPDNA